MPTAESCVAMWTPRHFISPIIRGKYFSAIRLVTLPIASPYWVGNCIMPVCISVTVSKSPSASVAWPFFCKRIQPIHAEFVVSAWRSLNYHGASGLRLTARPTSQRAGRADFAERTKRNRYHASRRSAIQCYHYPPLRFLGTWHSWYPWLRRKLDCGRRPRFVSLLICLIRAYLLKPQCIYLTSIDFWRIYFSSDTATLESVINLIRRPASYI